MVPVSSVLALSVVISALREQHRHLLQADHDGSIRRAACGGGGGEVGRHLALAALGERLPEAGPHRMTHAVRHGLLRVGRRLQHLEQLVRYTPTESNSP